MSNESQKSACHWKIAGLLSQFCLSPASSQFLRQSLPAVWGGLRVALLFTSSCQSWAALPQSCTKHSASPWLTTDTPRHYINNIPKNNNLKITNKQKFLLKQNDIYPPFFGEELTPNGLPNISGYVWEEAAEEGTCRCLQGESVGSQSRAGILGQHFPWDVVKINNHRVTP